MDILLSKNVEDIKVTTNIWIKSKTEEEIGSYKIKLGSTHNIEK